MDLVINEYLKSKIDSSIYRDEIEKKYASFVHYSLQKDSVIEKQMPKGSLILFVLSGRLTVSSGEYINKVIVAGDMIFLPPSPKYKLFALETSVLMNCEITPKTRTNAHKWFETLSGIYKEDNSKFTILPIKYNVRQFIEVFKYNLKNAGIDSPEIQEWKQEGLLLLLKSSYSIKELADFFSPILGYNMEFKEFVYTNCSSVNSLNEFAALAKCSLSVFCREFKKSFGESAYQWLLKRKSQFVLQDIINTSIPFQELADKYGFSSQSHFTKFCKQRYNDTPKNIRNSKVFKGKTPQYFV